ncbi:Abi-alpha family protein [Fodinicola feengrottensis]|uniref:Abi-alpha family protein n=1 Tax=Fodinicola feengrottensis TaxID=435914 RepID=UPI002442C374|nr:Abi-alpha family protein [Fodinicola feengrottensis]
MTADAREVIRVALGVVDAPDPLPKALRDRVVPADSSADRKLTVPERLAALLDASADLTYHEESHPAYVRLLSELSTDEARILRLIARRGPQAAVDVRTSKPFGAGSRLVAPGVTMIGRYAGCREVDRVPAYLNNLFRLGLVWFSRESLPEQTAYDVLEAQPEIKDAIDEAGGKCTTVRRSIELTAFGKNLCATGGLLPASAALARATKAEATRQLPPPDAR